MASSALSAPWQAALHVAESPSDPDTWTQELADALERAVRPDAAGVFICPLGNSLQAMHSVAPRDQAPLGRSLVHELLPCLRAQGLETPAELFADVVDAGERSLLRRLRNDLLAPAGYQSLLGRFFRSRDGMVAGWIAIFSRSLEAERLREIDAPFTAVGRAAEAALRNVIAVAAVLGGRFPKLSSEQLSEREREVANLAASGYSDLNIGGRLGISEGTVGRHLHNIYRKLGVSSRLELMDALCVTDDSRQLPPSANKSCPSGNRMTSSSSLRARP